MVSFGDEGTDWHAELKQIGIVAASSNWADDVYLRDTNFPVDSVPGVSTARETEIPDLNFTADEKHHEHTKPHAEVNLDDDVEDDDDPDYEVEADAEVENYIEDDGDTSERRLNMSLFAEYKHGYLRKAGWKSSYD